MVHAAWIRWGLLGGALLLAGSTASAQENAYAVGAVNISGMGEATQFFGPSEKRSATESNHYVPVPQAIRLAGMEVACDAAVVDGSQTFKVRVNGADAAGLSCAVSGGASTCNVGTATSAPVSAGQAYNFSVTAAAASTEPICIVTSRILTAASGPMDSHLSWGTPNTNITWTQGNNCGPGAPGNSYSVNLCGSADPTQAAFPLPGGTLSGFAVYSGAVGSGVSIDLRVCKIAGDNSCNGAANGETGLSVQVGNTTQVYPDTTCTESSTCTVNAGDRYYVKVYSISGTPAGTQRPSMTLTVDGIGQVLGAVRRHSSGIVYLLPSFDIAASGARFAADSVVRRLHAVMSTAPATSTDIVACVGASVSPSCPTPGGATVGCKITSPATSCSETANTVSVPAGSYVVLSRGSAGGTTGAGGYFAELIADVTHTPTPAATNTPTVTQTPTPTHTVPPYPGACCCEAIDPFWSCVTPLPADQPTACPTPCENQYDPNSACLPTD